MSETIGCLIFGSLLIFMGLVGSSLERLPLSAAMVYLGIGFLIGPPGADFLSMTLPDDVTRLRIAAEIGLLISLFAVGLRLRVPPADRRWILPLRLGFVAMIFTVAAIAALGVLVLHSSLGVAVLLGAMIAPTDPVLAHDVGVRDAGDVERVRFSLSGEGGINDGEATSTHPEKAPAFVAESVMGFTVELEHLAEAGLILLTGALVSRYWAEMLTWSAAGLVAILLFVIRPAATQLALIGSRASHHQRRLISWFGIRGVGSLYYLTLALEQGPRAQLLPLVPWVLSIIAVSIVLHGISAAPLMRRYA